MPAVSSTLDAPSRGLALRHRPRRLAEVVGQRHITAVLGRALAAGRLPSQLLFSGGSGLGKTTLARVVAAALLCDAPEGGDACGRCESCLDIADPARSHPDVIEFDAASHGGKDQIRDLAARAATAPIRGRWRIYIIDEAHGLTRDGGSAFLKLLEEPPAHVIFMLATTDPDKMLRTNRGRCVEFELLRPSDRDLVDHLLRVAAAEGWTLSEATASAVLDATDPALGVRGVLMTLEKLADVLSWGTDPTEDDLAQLLGVAPASLTTALTDAIDAGDRRDALAQLDRLRARVSDTQIRAGLLRWARSGLLAALDAGAPSEVALWRYETAAAVTGGTHATDVLVCRLAQPSLDPTPETTAAHLRDAEALLEQLSKGLRAARTETGRTPTPPEVEARTGPAQQSSTPPAEAAPPEATAADVPAGGAPKARFLATLEGDLAQLFAPGEVRLSANGDALVMTPRSDGHTEALKAARSELRAAADRAGVTLRLAVRR